MRRRRAPTPPPRPGRPRTRSAPSSSRRRPSCCSAKATAGRSARAKRAAAAGRCGSGLRADAPAQLRAVEAALAEAGRAAARRLTKPAWQQRAGAIIAALRRGAMAVAVASARRGEPARARAWLQIRDFRKATRFTRPGVDGTTAIQQLAAAEITPHEAVLQIEKDLLDTFQARLVTNLDEAARAAERGFDGRFAETAAIVLGYWRAIAPEYGEQRGASRARRHRSRLRRGSPPPRRPPTRLASRPPASGSKPTSGGFTAAPLTPEEEVNRASQLDRFLDLVPKEYEQGVSDGRVTIAFEIQEAVAFMDGVEAAFSDLEPVLLAARPGGGGADQGRVRDAARRRRRRPAGRAVAAAGGARRGRRARRRGIRTDRSRGVDAKAATKPTTNSSTSRSTSSKPRPGRVSTRRPSRRGSPPTASSSSGRS